MFFSLFGQYIINHTYVYTPHCGKNDRVHSRPEPAIGINWPRDW